MKKNLNLHIGKKKHLNVPFLCTEELAPLKKSWIWAVLSGTETIGHFLLDFLVIHKVKWTKRVLIWWKLKDNYFSHHNGFKWLLMDKRKLTLGCQINEYTRLFGTKETWRKKQTQRQTKVFNKNPPYSFIWPYSFNWHLRVSMFWGFLTPLPPPLSSNVSIWQDPP